MGEFNVEITGLDKALSKITRYTNVTPEKVKKAMIQTGYAIETEAKKNVPVDSGNLKSNITTSWSGDGPGQEKDGVGKPPAVPGEETVVVGSNVEYAKYQEFGFHGEVKVKAHTRGGSGVKAHTRKVNYAGKPYLYPAFQKKKGMLKKKLDKAVELDKT